MILGDAIFTNAFLSTPFGRDVDLTSENVFLFLGPRIVAGATLSPLVWMARFAFFVAAAWFGLHPGPAH